jgi:hypothetical protein
MTPHIHSFLKAVLGDEAAGALKKAADRSDSLTTVLGARAVVGWLSLASRWGYEGEVPGLPGSFLTFAKSEETDLFSGEVRFGKDIYKFEQVDLPHVAAGLSVALGADQEPDEALKDTDLVALGQNIDLLLKTQFIKAEESTSDSSYETSSTSSEEDSLDKAGGTTSPGAPAAQKPPAGPTGGGFTAPTGKAPSRGKKKGFGTKLTMSQASSKCSVCGEAQFSGDRFTGCYCIRDLAKHAQVVGANTQGYVLDFDPEFWNKSDVALLMDIVEGA